MESPKRDITIPGVDPTKLIVIDHIRDYCEKKNFSLNKDYKVLILEQKYPLIEELDRKTKQYAEKNGLLYYSSINEGITYFCPLNMNIEDNQTMIFERGGGETLPITVSNFEEFLVNCPWEKFWKIQFTFRINLQVKNINGKDTLCPPLECTRIVFDVTN